MEIEMNDDPGFEIPGDDPLDQARHRFRKGRLEFMGGPVVYEQGHGCTYEELNPKTLQFEKKTLMNNERRIVESYPQSMDPEAAKLGVDHQEP